jgi:dimeric dUTPase (all-alpha-NTP-PPase superfamily)
MAKMQCDFNVLANPEWITAGQDWNRASMIEIVELFDHVGKWKWWKHMDVDLVQGQIELIDVFHFVLSFEVERAHGDLDLAAKTMFDEWHSEEPVISVDGKEYIINRMSFLEQLDLMVALFALKRPSMFLLSRIMLTCEIDGDLLYYWYVSKNVLNTFRQHNGYKTGDYIKMWNVDGEIKEDNAVMEIIAGTLDTTSPTFPVELYEKLGEYYEASKSAGQ